MPLPKIADWAPDGVVAAVEVTNLASGASVIALSDPTGYGGYRLSGYALHTRHATPGRQSRARRELAHALASMEDRVAELQSILAHYVTDGVITDGRKFMASFRLERDSQPDRWLTVISSPDGTERYVLGSYHDVVGDGVYPESAHASVVREFRRWMLHDRARRRTARRRCAH